MSRTLIAVALVGSCCGAVGAQADEFSWDLFGGLQQGSRGDSQDWDGSALSASHYFAPVDDSRGPYELASFLDPVSSVSAGVSRQNNTYHPINVLGPPGFVPRDTSVKVDEYTVGGRYVLPASKWYAGGDYTKTTTSPYSFFTDEKTYRLLAGKYLGANTSLELTVSRVEQSDDGLVDSTTEAFGPSFLHVGQLRSLSYSLFGGVSQTSTHLTIQPSANSGVGLSESLPRYWTYSVGTELFPTTKLGLRVSFTRVYNDSYDVAATWFVKRKMGLQFTWSQTQYSSGPSTDTASVRFVGRF